MKKIVFIYILSVMLLTGCLNRNTPVDYVDDEMFELIGECGTTGYTEDIAIGDSSLIYVAAGEAGIEIIDISDFANPVLTGFADPLSEEYIARITVIPESNLLLSVRSSKKVSFWDSLLGGSGLPIKISGGSRGDKILRIFKALSGEGQGQWALMPIFAAPR